MQTEWSLEFSSALAAPSDSVWRAISMMRGVNDELMPIIRMTYPSEARDKSIDEAPTGELLFRSWILLFGFLPIDLHSLQLTRVEPGRGLLEESTSWCQAYWRHERTIEGDPSGGCRLTDNLRFRPRLRFMGAGIAWFIRRIFTHRHRQLRARFGEAGR